MRLLLRKVMRICFFFISCIIFAYFLDTIVAFSQSLRYGYRIPRFLTECVDFWRSLPRFLGGRTEAVFSAWISKTNTQKRPCSPQALALPVQKKSCSITFQSDTSGHF